MRTNTLLRLVIPAAALAITSCHGGKTASVPEAEAAVPVRTVKPERLQRPAYVSVSGTVEARDSADLGFQVAGRVARVFVDEGQIVKRGQLLAQLDPADYRFAEQASAAQIEAARATLEKSQNATRPEELEQARAAYDRAQDEYERYKQLYERKSMAPADFQKVEAAYRAARAQFEMAQNGARKEDRAAAAAMVQQAEAQAGANRKRVADTRLTSPISGAIARRAVDPGEMVAAGMPVITVVDLDPARVRIGVPEADIGRVRTGQRATVVIPALDEREFEGKVELVGVAADPSSRTFTAKILVPNPQHTLRAGMIAEARVQGTQLIDVLTVPGSAIVPDAQGATHVFVYYPDQKRVHARRVEVGTVRGNSVEITRGLNGDELVVMAGQQKLREGAAVEVVR